VKTKASRLKEIGWTRPETIERRSNSERIETAEFDAWLAKERKKPRPGRKSKESHVRRRSEKGTYVGV
jgi:hypothetical protein